MKNQVPEEAEQAVQEVESLLPFTFGALPPFLFIIASMLIIPALPIALIQSIQSPLIHFFYFLHLLLFTTGVCMAFFSLAYFTIRAGIPGVIMFLIVMVSTVLAVMMAALPPTLPESLFFLQVVKGWSFQAYLESLSWMDYAFHPLLPALGLSTLYYHGVSALVPMYQAGQLLILSASVLYFLDVLKTPAAVTASAVAMIATTPLFIFMGGTLSPLLSYCLYGTIALIAIILWANRTMTLFHLLLASFSMALLASSAYQGLLLALIMMVLMFFPAILPERRVMQILFGFAVIMIVTPTLAAPWYMKNMIFRSNPVYPLFMDPDEDVRATMRVRGKSLSLIIDEERALNTPQALSEHAISLVAGGGSPLSYLGIEAQLTPLYLAVASSIVLLPWTPFPLFVLISAALGYALLSLVTPPMIQILIPFFPMFAVMTALGIHRILSFVPKLPADLLTFCVIILCQIFLWFGTLGTILATETTQLWFKGSIEKSAYLRTHIKEFPVIEHINASVPADARIMLVYMGDYYYYYEREIVSEGAQSAGYLHYLLDNAKDARSLARQFHFSGITHIVINKKKLFKHIPSRALTIFDSFQKLYLDKEFSFEDYVVWSLRPPEHPHDPARDTITEEIKE